VSLPDTVTGGIQNKNNQKPYSRKERETMTTTITSILTALVLFLLIWLLLRLAEKTGGGW